MGLNRGVHFVGYWRYDDRLVDHLKPSKILCIFVKIIFSVRMSLDGLHIDQHFSSQEYWVSQEMNTWFRWFSSFSKPFLVNVVCKQKSLQTKSASSFFLENRHE